MLEKAATMCADETFHPAPCFVAIEPVSTFIVVESHVGHRDAGT